MRLRYSSPKAGDRRPSRLEARTVPGSAGELKDLHLPLPAAFSGAHDVGERRIAGRSRHALGTIDQHQHTRLAARVEPGNPSRDSESARAPPIAAPARSRSWRRRCSRGLCAAGSIDRYDCRPSAIASHSSISSAARRSGRANRGSGARRSPERIRQVAPPRSDGATLAEPAPRSVIAIASSKLPPSSCSNIEFTNSGISGRRVLSIEPKSSEVSSSFVAPARLTIRGSSPTASSTSSAGRRQVALQPAFAPGRA